MVNFREILVEYLTVFGIEFFHSLVVANKLPSGNLLAIFSRCSCPLRYEQQKAGVIHEGSVVTFKLIFLFTLCLIKVVFYLTYNPILSLPRRNPPFKTNMFLRLAFEMPTSNAFFML